MAVVSVAKIKAIGYDSLSLQRDEIITDENSSSFSWTGPFAMLSNRAIPKNSKVYIEITVDSPPHNRDIRHIPLCLGVHKEPSFGIMGSDCSLGAIYYTRNTYISSDQINNVYLTFCIREKYHADEVQTRFVRDTRGRVPVKGTVVGLGVDMINNTISIYTDGVLFYEWQPALFNMNEEEASFYFAAYCPERGEPVSGNINFGRYRTTYLPDGYVDFYQQLYDRTNVKYDILSYLNVKAPYDNSLHNDVINGDAVVENEIAPIDELNRRDIKLILSNDAMVHYKDYDKTIVNYHGFIYRPNDVDYAYIQYPMGVNRRIYFEFHSSEATVLSDYVGIPLTIGITKNPNDLSIESLQIDLAHLRVDGYHIRTVKDGVTILAGNYDILNPIPPLQPNVVGILVDLLTNTLEIYTEGSLYTVIKPNTNLANFNDPLQPVYFFFKPDKEKFTGQGKVIVNLGTLSMEAHGSGGSDEDIAGYLDDDLRYAIADNMDVVSYWWYYNYPIRVTYYKDFLATIKAISDHISISKYIYASITVPATSANGRNEERYWGPGLNAMHSSYNTISKESGRSGQPDVSIFDLKRVMDEDAETNKR